jgi:hypothetical protein
MVGFGDLFLGAGRSGGGWTEFCLHFLLLFWVWMVF